MSASGMACMARCRPAVVSAPPSSVHPVIFTGTPSWATHTSVECSMKSSYGSSATPPRPHRILEDEPVAGVADDGDGMPAVGTPRASDHREGELLGVARLDVVH